MILFANRKRSLTGLGRQLSERKTGTIASKLGCVYDRFLLASSNLKGEDE